MNLSDLTNVYARFSRGDEFFFIELNWLNEMSDTIGVVFDENGHREIDSDESELLEDIKKSWAEHFDNEIAAWDEEDKEFDRKEAERKAIQDQENIINQSRGFGAC